MGQNTARDRLAPSRGPFFPHPGVRRFFGAVQIMHIFFNISYFLKITVNTLIGNNSLQHDSMGSLLARTYHIQNALLP